MQELVTLELVRAAPSLPRLGELRTEWTNGIQFYLETDEPSPMEHVVDLDSNWALKSVSQRQFWRGTDLSKYGDGRVGGILSVGIERDSPGYVQSKAGNDTGARGDQGVWSELKAALNSPGQSSWKMPI